MSPLSRVMTKSLGVVDGRAEVSFGTSGADSRTSETRLAHANENPHDGRRDEAERDDLAARFARRYRNETTLTDVERTYQRHAALSMPSPA